MRIAGIDVSRGKVSVCVLSELPENLKEFAENYYGREFCSDHEGIENLLSLDFQVAILEPTGKHYSKIWAYHLENSGREVRWVKHKAAAAYRESHDINNKDDLPDAVALACYGLERLNRPNAFIDPEKERLFELFQELENLTKIKTVAINRLRQQLSHEFPEVSHRAVVRKWLSPQPPGLWLAIANEKWSKKWQKEYDRSIGTGIGQFSQSLAAQVCSLERQEYLIEQSIASETQKAKYAPYLNAFSRLGIGNRTAAALMVIYPFERFLDKDGAVIKQKKRRNRDGRTVKTNRNRSLARFKLSMGMGRVLYKSGDGQLKWKPGGPSHVRVALWRWCEMNIKRNPNLDNPHIKELYDYYKNGVEREIWKDGQLQQTHFNPGKGNQRIMRVARRLVEKLFWLLVEEFQS
ncbi:IS110 family transposase [Egbenema bharatensis]|uniref:IS110 family transposase n=1 Tax=Egbenema bharatensis TaxID=3463334 RepID=UPI003A84C364